MTTCASSSVQKRKAPFRAGVWAADHGSHWGNGSAEHNDGYPNHCFQEPAINCDPRQLELFADSVCAVAGAPLAKPQQSTEAELQAKLDGARQRLRQIVVLGLKSWLLEETPKELAKIEGYARGQVRVHHRILERFRDGHRH